MSVTKDRARFLPTHSSLINTHGEWYFQHIPKTAGTSIASYFNLRSKGHMPVLRDSMPEDPYKTYCVLRDPIDRFLSAHFMYVVPGMIPEISQNLNERLEREFIGATPLKTLMNLTLFIDREYRSTKSKRPYIGIWPGWDLTHFVPQMMWIKNTQRPAFDFVIDRHINFLNLEREFFEFLSVTHKNSYDLSQDFPYKKKSKIQDSRWDHVDEIFVNGIFSLYILDYQYALENCKDIFDTWKFSKQIKKILDSGAVGPALSLKWYLGPVPET